MAEDLKNLIRPREEIKQDEYQQTMVAHLQRGEENEQDQAIYNVEKNLMPREETKQDEDQTIVGYLQRRE